MKRVALLGVLILCGCAGAVSPTGIDEQEIGDSGGVKGIYASDARVQGQLAVVSFDGNRFDALLCVTSRCRDEDLVLVSGTVRFQPATNLRPDRMGLLRIDAGWVADVDPYTTCPALGAVVYHGPECAPLPVQAVLGRDNTLWLPDLCDGNSYPVSFIPPAASAE